MSDFHPTHQATPRTESAVARNRVLRNTYWMLALSMIPTVLGAFFGLSFNVGAAMANSPGTSLIIFLAGAFGLMFLVEKNKNSSMGVVFLLAFTFFMGVMLSRVLGFVLGFQNGAQLVMLAFGGTGAVFFSLASTATIAMRYFIHFQRFFTTGVIILILAAVVSIFLQLPALMLTISVVAIAKFSVFLLVALQRISHGGDT